MEGKRYEGRIHCAIVLVQSIHAKVNAKGRRRYV